MICNQMNMLMSFHFGHTGRMDHQLTIVTISKIDERRRRSTGRRERTVQRNDWREVTQVE